MTLCRIFSPLGRPVNQPLIIIAAVCSFASGLRAELPVFRLDGIYPPSAKAGAAVSVGVTAVDGGEAKELLFSHPGLSGVWKEKGRFEVTISPDVPVGMYEVRAAGSLGFSNPRSFLVAKEDQVLPPKAAASVAEALELKSGIAVVGKVTAAAFAAKPKASARSSAASTESFFLSRSFMARRAVRRPAVKQYIGARSARAARRHQA